MRNAEKLRSTASEYAKETRENAKDLYDKGRERASHIYEDTLTTLDSAQEQIRKYGDVVSREMQNHPITYSLIIVGISCLIASIFTRRRN